MIRPEFTDPQSVAYVRLKVLRIQRGDCAEVTGVALLDYIGFQAVQPD